MSKTTIPRDFEVTAEMRAWAREKCPGVDIDGELEKFRDYWLACGRQMADWAATWRNWMRRAPQFAKKNGIATRWRPEGVH